MPPVKKRYQEYADDASSKQQKILAEAVPASSGKMSTANSTSKGASDDCIIGLDLGGRLFYTHLSTLTSAKGMGGGPNYFAARFGSGSSGIPAGASRTDEFGREVYFLDRADDLFRYILQFLRENTQTWPSFASDPILWNRLRAEAQYYMLADLYDALGVTHSCRPRKDDDRGILFWLGTKRGKSKGYCNPYDLKEVDVYGSFDEKSKNWDDVIGIMDNCKELKESRRAFVQYRPTIKKFAPKQRQDGADDLWCYMKVDSEHADPFDCDSALNGDYACIRFKNVAVRPTHFSMRYAQCYGMDMFNFEASEDGSHWDILHEVRCDPKVGRQPTVGPTITQQTVMASKIKAMYFNPTLKPQDEPKVQDTLLNLAESCYRGRWTLANPSDKFYLYFRVVGAGEECLMAHREKIRLMGLEAIKKREKRPDEDIPYEEGDEEEYIEDYGCNPCIHGVGFEVFGDVQEYR